MIPKFCPRCGLPLDDIEIVIFDRTSLLSTIKYDVLCEHCEWSGEISPDSDVDIELSEEKIEELVKSEEKPNVKIYNDIESIMEDLQKEDNGNGEGQVSTGDSEDSIIKF